MEDSLVVQVVEYPFLQEQIPCYYPRCLQVEESESGSADSQLSLAHRFLAKSMDGWNSWESFHFLWLERQDPPGLEQKADESGSSDTDFELEIATDPLAY